MLEDASVRSGGRPSQGPGSQDAVLTGTFAATLGGTGLESLLVLANSILNTQVGTSKTLLAPLASTEVLALLGNEGADTFDITTYDSVNALLAVDGDLPSAKRFSDNMIVRNGQGKVTFSAVKAHAFENGSVFAKYKTGNSTRINYTSVEGIKFFR